MQRLALTLVLALTGLLASPFHASAQSTYTTTNGTVNLFAGLTNLTSTTAINTTNQSVGIGYITDGSWSTGIANLGGEGPFPAIPNNGTLAGDFGGATYFAAGNGIMLIGTGTPSLVAWGSWTIRLLLANDTYSSPISFTNSDLVQNLSVLTATNTDFFQNWNGTTIFPGATT